MIQSVHYKNCKSDDTKFDVCIHIYIVFYLAACIRSTFSTFQDPELILRWRKELKELKAPVRFKQLTIYVFTVWLASLQRMKDVANRIIQAITA